MSLIPVCIKREGRPLFAAMKQQTQNITIASIKEFVLEHH